MRISVTIALILGFLSSPFLGCGDDDFGGALPEMFVEDSVTFPTTQLGSFSERTLTIENRGGGDLVIADLIFTNETNTAEFSRAEVALPLTITSGDVYNLTLRYAPIDLGDDQGGLRIVNNSRNGEVVVRLRTAGATSQLVANPARLELLSEGGLPTSGDVQLSNQGQVPIRIVGVQASEDTDDDLALEPVTLPEGVLENGDVFTVTATYTPTVAGGAAGTIEVEYEYVEEGTTGPASSQILPVPMFGRRPAAQILVTPDSVNFGAIDEGTESDPTSVVIKNIGVRPLEVTELAFSVLDAEDNDQFELLEVPDFAEGPLVLQPDEQTAIQIIYRPTEPANHAATLQIRSNSVEDGTKLVSVLGRVRRPCLEILPSEVNLGVVALNIESVHTAVSITNCGDLPVDISSIQFADGGDFEWAPSMGAWNGSTTIEPLAAFPIEVWYTNRGIAQGSMLSNELIVSNNTPDQPELSIPVNVTGGGAPTCDLLLLPNRVDFGLVARGRNVLRTVEVLNRGTGYCELRNQELAPVFDLGIPIIPGFNDVKFTIVRPAPLGQIAPSQRVPIDVIYRPTTFSLDGAKLKLSYWDPYEMEDKIVEGDLSGLGGESTIEVIPSRMDFGLVTAGDCASREERVTVYNTGIVNLCITDVALEGPDCSEFLITERPRANGDGCILVSRDSPADVKLVYQPTNLGPDNCNLVFRSDASNESELIVPLEGEGTNSRSQVDTFVQTSGQTVDVLFVVDNSGSMSEEQSNLRDSFTSFIAGADQFSNDFQIGLVTMDMQNDDDAGRLQGSTRIVSRSPNASSEFIANTRSEFLGTNGSGTEEGLAAAEAALTDPLIYDTGVSCSGDGDCVSPDTCIEGRCGGFNRGFLREEAALEVIFVSDEDDGSPGTLNFYVDFLKNLKGYRNEGRMHAHAIVGAENGRASACDGPGGDATRGERYVEVAQRTNGGIYSICDEDFGTPLRMIGNQAFGLPVQFFLSRPALSSTISVEVDGQSRQNGWSYDRDSNSVIFEMGSVPQPGQTIQIEYEAECFARQ